MPRRGKKSAYSADDWLLEPASGRSKDPEPEAAPEDGGRPAEAGSNEPQTGGDPAGPEISQWLVDSNGGRNGSSTEAVDDTAAESVDSEAESVDSQELTQVRDRLERTESEAVRPATDSQVKLKRVEQAIAERIARFEDTLAEQQLRIADLEELLERREA
jgi:hypothetical protein